MKNLLVAFLVCLISVGGAQATIIERTTELDLRTLALPTSNLHTRIAVDTFSLDIGDSLLFHLKFVGGRLGIKDSAFSVEDYIGLQFLSNPTGQTGFLYTGEWHFENVMGELLANDIKFLYGGPIGGFTANTNLTDSYFSMSGLTYTVNVTYKEIGRPAFTSDSVDLDVFTGGSPVDAVTIHSVPEPSSMLLTLAAVVGLMVAWGGKLTPSR